MLMNLEGVALAADSAVTMQGGGRVRPISQSGVDKIFVLDDASPVGAMVYGLATFDEFPWKTVLQAFSAQANGRFDGVQDCSGKLTRFLAELDGEGSAGLKVPAAAEVDSFRQYVLGFVDRYYVLVVQRADEAQGPLPASVFELALSQLRDEILEDADYVAEQIVKPPSARVKRAVIGKPTERLSEFLGRHLDTALSRSLKRYFGASVPPDEVREGLARLCAQSVLVDWLPPAAWHTGLVLAGFGRRDFVPFYVNLHIQGAFAGVLQHRYEKVGAPIAGRSPVVFESYAQDELIVAFKSGAQQRFMALAYMAAVAGLAQTFGDMLEVVARKDQALAREAAIIADRALFQVPAIAFEHAMADREAHVARTLGPLLDSASVEVLGRHASKLVQLSILEHELTGSGMVGRPISVLKMEKGKCRLEKDVSV
jgi:hypothetical protein